MRILNAESLEEMIAKYSTASKEDHLLGNIVLSNHQKRRDLRSNLIRRSCISKSRMNGLVVVFESGSLIRLSIAAERPGAIIFDDILVDEEIHDVNLLMLLDRAEYFKGDFGEIEPSEEIIEYLGGVV